MKKEKRFEIVYQEGGFMSAKTIYVDKETGVNYLFIVSGYAGGLTPLLDAEGNPSSPKKRLTEQIALSCPARSGALIVRTQNPRPG